jgi:hypothetical protein
MVLDGKMSRAASGFWGRYPLQRLLTHENKTPVIQVDPSAAPGNLSLAGHAGVLVPRLCA